MSQTTSSLYENTDQDNNHNYDDDDDDDRNGHANTDDWYVDGR